MTRQQKAGYKAQRRFFELKVGLWTRNRSSRKTQNKRGKSDRNSESRFDWLFQQEQEYAY